MSFRLLFRRVIALACLASTAGTLAAIAAESPQISADQPAVGIPEWIRSAVVYEVNVRQYSRAGNFAAVTADLPRLHNLGIDVLWLMPIYPIGEKNRKGTLGSYYAVRDYEAVNPELGPEADFKRLVDAAHAAGLRVILDWVGNHTAWDNPLATLHPDYYVHDEKGNFTPPTGFDWTDVIQLDFLNPAVLEFQFKAMARWVREFGVDGFRCDFATGVPTIYWNTLVARLRAIRPDLFFLAESELPQQQVSAFNASYAFDMMKTFNAIAQGQAGVSSIDDTLAAEHVQFPAGAALLYYTSNHDENSWAGTVFERLGGGVRAFAVLSFMLDGIPLIYDGQEVGLDRRLAFFEHDPIVWPGDHPLTDFYRVLCNLRHEETALRAGSPMRRIPTTRNDSIYAIWRSQGDSRVVAFLNLTARDVTADAFDPALTGKWRDLFTGEAVAASETVHIALHSWEYRVWRSAR